MPKTPTLESVLRTAIDHSGGSLDDDAVISLAITGLTDDEKDALLQKAAQRVIPQVRASRLRRAVQSITNPNLKAGHSAHVLRVHADWQRFLAQALPTGAGNIRVADATVDDLRRAAAQRRKHANELIVEAERWEKVASVLATSGLKTVGDLPPQRI